MNSIRQNKVARLIQKELGIIFQKETGVLVPGAMVSVTVVRVSPDLAIARVYLSLFPPEKSKDLYETICNHNKHWRFELGQKVKNQMRVVPELSFFIDDSLDYIEKIDKLIH
ncbi:MAG: 30S ribosome-binding factor RbfA [Bacteroidia bacterium]|nr:30S ribosome-binding factor RbfA [Bacteroidia bacterium]